MNVIKIVVDETKGCCSECELSFYSKEKQLFICFATKNQIHDSQDVPSWCPLVVEDVCEWHETEVNEHGWRFWMTGCKIKYDSSVQITKGEFNFCPSCGKRIKYVEVE